VDRIAVTQAERIFAANFPDTYRAALVRFPEPESAAIEAPRGKMSALPFENGPTLAQPGVKITPEVARERMDLRLQRQRDHQCMVCGDPAKFYPSRKFNQWGKRCELHANGEAAYIRAKRKQLSA
jgi:hypothetical protein